MIQWDKLWHHTTGETEKRLPVFQRGQSWSLKIVSGINKSGDFSQLTKEEI
jgi:hypothetical protein